MKKYFMCLMTVIGCFASAQEYEVTPEGLRDKSDESKTYVVFNVDSISASVLYKRAVQYVNENYKNPNEAMKANTEGEYLRVDTYVPQFVRVNNSGAKLDVSAKYSMDFRFKDGKVKFEITNLLMTADNGGREVYFKGSIWKGYPIYKETGELRLEDTKMDLENYFNAQINLIIEFLKKDQSQEDW